jgi:beta-RFAP synthase
LNQPPSVVVEAPARLHLGFLDMEGGLGRRFGSLGVAIEEVATRIRAGHAERDRIEGPQQERALAILARLRAQLSVPPMRITIEQAIPAHAGLGSGTQLGLAVGSAANLLFGLGRGPEDLARLLERGARSGIGLGAFTQGGVLLDGGRGDEEAPPPIIGRVAFPATWRILLLLDKGRRGLSGDAERAAFAALPPFPPELAGRLCRLAVMAFLPGVALADLNRAGTAIGEIQRAVGDHFAPAQGGRFTSRKVAAALAWLEGRGHAGVGQSSWGPTGFALLEAATADAVAADLAAAVPGLDLRLVHGRNRGAVVSVRD